MTADSARPQPDALSAHLDDLDAAAGACVDRLAEVAAELHDVLVELVSTDNERRACAGQLGIHVRRPPAAEHAAEYLLHAMRPLFPHVAHSGEETAARALEQLQMPTRDLALPL